MRKLLNLFLILVVLGAIGAGAVAWWGHRWLQTPIASLTQPLVFEVRKGASLRTIASRLVNCEKTRTLCPSSST